MLVAGVEAPNYYSPFKLNINLLENISFYDDATNWKKRMTTMMDKIENIFS